MYGKGARGTTTTTTLMPLGPSTLETNWNLSRIKGTNCHTFQSQFVQSIQDEFQFVSGVDGYPFQLHSALSGLMHNDDMTTGMPLRVFQVALLSSARCLNIYLPTVEFARVQKVSQ